MDRPINSCGKINRSAIIPETDDPEPTGGSKVVCLHPLRCVIAMIDAVNRYLFGVHTSMSFQWDNVCPH